MKVSPLQRVMPGTSVELVCEVNISEIQRRLDGETFSLKWSLAEEGDTLAVMEVTRNMEVVEEQVVEGARMETVRGEESMQWNMVMANVNINNTGLYECQVSKLDMQRWHSLNYFWLPLEPKNASMLKC